jgi:tRNA(Ile)-lysidine synthase
VIDAARAAVRAFFAEHAIPPSSLVLALSGGIDSTALLVLLEAFRAEGFALSAAHVNHHLRGDESDADEQFVRDLCARFGIDVDVASGPLASAQIKAHGIEAAAREVRYAALQQIRERRGARFLATAHQKNDQAETVMMRMLSGSSVLGMRGIHPVREDGVLRPLLALTRDQLSEALREAGITARLDSSNDNLRFLRNRVRAYLREHGGVEELAAMAAEARARWPELEAQLAAAEAEFLEERTGETIFRGFPETEWIRHALLRRQVRRLDPRARDFDPRRLSLEAPRQSVTRTLELRRQSDTPATDSEPPQVWRLVRRTPPQATPMVREITFETHARIEELALTMRVARGSSSLHEAGRQRFVLPEGAEAVFTVRTRREGDRFQPLGMDKSKKLKDFLIDRKIARDRRDRLPLLLWNGEIVWIGGVEISERFKVTSPERGTLYEVWLEGLG